MLTLALLSLLSQKCITVHGVRACGYSCVENGSQGQCAKTPEGVCHATTEGLVCFDPPSWLKAFPRVEWRKPTCVTDGTEISCGYDCKRGSGSEMKCAKTPKGVCRASGGRVTCFDPSPVVYGVFGGDVPAPSCKQSASSVACGYACAGGGLGTVRCAGTPFGTCTEFASGVTCVDPPAEVICAKGKSTPSPTCVRGLDSVACGYHCVSAGSTTACAKTPEGSCDKVANATCFDPPARGGTAACLETMADKGDAEEEDESPTAQPLPPVNISED